MNHRFWILLHTLAGCILGLFILLHLGNHLLSLGSIETHIAGMQKLRHVYRSGVGEFLLLISVALQLASGLRLFIGKFKYAKTYFDKMQVWSGLYLAFFLTVHVSVVLVGRLYLHLDTNFYFGAAGLNTFPLNLFFLPYYGLAILAVFSHVAAIYHRKVKRPLAGLTPFQQAVGIQIAGMLVLGLTFYGLTQHFRGIELPKEYLILIGK